MKPYKIHRLTVRQTLGVSEFDADLAGKSATISGSNAKGKSSLLRAIACCLGLDRTSLARLAPLKAGEAALDPSTGEPLVPEVCLLLKGDGAPDLRIRAEGDTRYVEEQEGAAWRRTKKPVGGLLSRLVDPLANPAAFLSAKPDQQIEWVLEALPCEGYSRQGMLESAQDAVGTMALPALKPIQAGLHPLDDIEAVASQVFGFRTDVGREETLAKSTAARILAGLPAEPPAEPSDSLAVARLAYQTVCEQIATAEASVVAEHRRIVEGATAAHEARLAEIRSSHLAEIRAVESAHESEAAALRAACEKRIAELRAEADVRIDALDTRAEEQRVEAAQVYKASRSEADADLSQAQAAITDLIQQRERLASESASLEEQAKAAATDARVRAEARKAEDEAAVLGARYSALTRALDAIKAYRAQLAASIPIRGLEIRLGEKREVLVDGIPWQTVNTARKATVALELAMLRAQAPAGEDEPRLMVALLDDAEHFDVESRDALIAAAESAGVQLILAEVNAGGGPLEVR